MHSESLTGNTPSFSSEREDFPSYSRCREALVEQVFLKICDMSETKPTFFPAFDKDERDSGAISTHFVIRCACDIDRREYQRQLF